MKIILASKSQARRQILEQIGFEVVVHPTDIVEKKISSGSLEDVVKLAKSNSYAKAYSISKKYIDSVVLAADTLIFYKGMVYGKPSDINDAYRILSKLRASMHYVVTGYTVIYEEKKRMGFEITEVYMRNYSDKEIEYYLQTDEWMGKAGAYAIQGIGAFLIKKINGCFYNVIGLPLSKLIEDFKSLDIWPP